MKERLRKIVGETGATEIMAMEQQLMAEGVPVEEVRSMSDLHSQVTCDVLVQLPPPSSIQPGHPIEGYTGRNGFCNTVEKAQVTKPKLALNPKHPERVCWGCDKYCSADDLRCGNGTIRTQHPVELFGENWLEWELNHHIPESRGVTGE